MFSKRFKLGTIGDIPFHVSLLWIFVFILVTYSLSHPPVIERYVSFIEPLSSHPLDQPLFENVAAQVAFALILALSLYGSVVLHELGHIYGARKNNVGVAGITLWILGGAAQMTEEPEDPGAEFELTIAGPLVSFALGVGALILAAVVMPLAIGPLTAYFLLIALLNLGMLILNLIPAFPLDGGRLLRAGLSAMFGYERGTMYATRVGKSIALGVAVISLLTTYLWGILLAGFVFFAAHVESKRVSKGLTISQLTGNDATIPITGNTFVFETEIPGYTLPEATAHIERRGGDVDLHISENTDYLVVPAGSEEMFQTLASHHDATIVTDEAFTSAITFDADTAQEKSRVYTDSQPDSPASDRNASNSTPYQQNTRRDPDESSFDPFNDD